MKTFLIPVDFSENTLTTCKQAIYLTGTKKTKIFLFHIYPDQIIVPDSSFPVGIENDAFFNLELIETIRKQAEKSMQELEAKISDLCITEGYENIEVSYLVTGGDPEWEIHNICEEIKPDLIVMGTEGEGKKGILEGSMAENIMNKVEIPVVAVPGVFEKDRMINIMYATKLGEMDIAALKKVLQLLGDFDIVIHVTHFHFDKIDERSKALMEELEQEFSKEKLMGKVTFNLVPATDKEDVLIAFTEKYEIDLIAFLSHKRNFFYNLFSHKISKKDFFKLDLPMLALHEQTI
jgi:nucleotide-binding universal stress UspA family protein